MINGDAMPNSIPKNYQRGSLSGRHIDPNIITVDRLQKLLSRLERKGECWVHKRPHHSGYAYVGIKGTYYGVHRLLKVVSTGKPIPKGYVSDHTCKNKSCANPKHIDVVTQSINIARGTALLLSAIKTLAKTHCPHGHPYSGDNLIINKSNGGRQCKECRKAMDKRRRPRKDNR